MHLPRNLQGSPLSSVMRTLAAFSLVFAASMATAQQNPADFPLDSVGYLNEELPRMEAAIAAKDRSFFHDAMARTVEFSDRWGFKVKANPDLAAYPMCTAAVMDYVVVGMCKLTPGDDACEPGLAARFDSNVKRCREIAARK
ncbi:MULTISPECIES: hypothetical protein [Variovorax]|uniref:hypothetical protein n=2 Tax=Comamonadaceae TaxID=80864 RepID=UPI00086AA39A|nr:MULTISPECIES: hypothetical protein [Variovorax]ODV16532.1 MAG: hypothetical protein ABT25_31145 [Variovorax sp. SCN 67-20]MBN8758363.1 hypothetical protein [Variovorax sp.]ODU13162.1 MAG: hypothetical protein ABS94_28020 [Variovorax sp. SCN 67-85]OJZ07389.1 MAG: hypothetical protein BGP22_17685 [Variovorax sp. 67-131]UKI10704.1 hypothetical protein L3V85_12895 [Variovorax paradoxus]